MTTVLDIINSAMKKAGILGVGQTALAEDINDAFDDLNDMVGQWNRKRWLIWHLIDVAKVSTGAVSYTVGPGGDFDTPRPDRLEAAFFRQLVPSQPNKIDYRLELIEARETYNDIALKTLQTFPDCIFYDSAYPLGVVYPYPVPQPNMYEIHLTLKETIPRFRNLTQDVCLPPEHYAGLKFNLAIRLKQAYQLPVDNALVGLAKDSLNVIRGADTQIARLRMPNDLMGRRTYNIFSDQCS